jgi:hypothetical protein
MIETYPAVFSVLSFERTHVIVGAAFKAAEDVEAKYRHVLRREHLSLERICLSVGDHEQEIKEEWHLRICVADRPKTIILSAEGSVEFPPHSDLRCLLAGEIVETFFDRIMSTLTADEKRVLGDVKRMQPFRRQDDEWVAAKDVSNGLPSAKVMQRLQQICDKGALFSTSGMGFNGRRFKIPPQVLDRV